MKIRRQGEKTLLNLISQVAEKYALSPEKVAELLSQTFHTAFLKEYPDNVVDVNIDLKNEKIEIWRHLQVVTDEYFSKEGFEDYETLIPISKVSKLPRTSKNPPKPQVGDTVYQEVEIEDFDSKITNNIQLFFKKLTQTEVSKNICQKWSPFQGKVIEGTVEEIIENKDDRKVKKIIVSLIAPDGTVAKGLIFRSDIVWIDGPNGTRIYENLALGQTYLFYVKEISEMNMHFPITLSRIDAEIVKFVMAKHISEMAEGKVEIRGIARIAGLKTKVLVHSNDPNIDPVGCCIGPKGKRLKVISSELLNEKIDVILWNDDPVQNVINAFVTGKIIGYKVEDENEITLVATLDNLLSCIGKRGSNTKLVYMLTNWKINLKTIQEAKDENLDYIAIDDDKFSNSNKISERIFKMHYKKNENAMRELKDRSIDNDQS
ncbi:transcription termination factor [Candidatus Mycoplasma haematobovis]|uniref:Transcription termination factor n=1 Tax=Candidatus Mycoplasma haematobovis TaxID=432608 RepID=A0A1A9QD47_9MOLU|nr:NusA N-terminal domain-containing protein [Candidatus Mycoplasma haematobovis]OAL10397.1 transcription termination factor [Candidatus Mycoplasma haematobovis]